MIDHDQHPQLGVFGALRITIDCYTKSLVKLLVRHIPVAGTYALSILGSRVDEEQVGSSPLCNGIDVAEDVLSYPLKVLVDDEVRIDIDQRTSLKD